VAPEEKEAEERRETRKLLFPPLLQLRAHVRGVQVQRDDGESCFGTPSPREADMTGLFRPVLSAETSAKWMAKMSCHFGRESTEERRFWTSNLFCESSSLHLEEGLGAKTAQPLAVFSAAI